MIRFFKRILRRFGVVVFTRQSEIDRRKAMNARLLKGVANPDLEQRLREMGLI